MTAPDAKPADVTEPQWEQESENEGLVFYVGPRIRNQKELIAKLDIDTDFWEPYKSEVNPYQVQAKREFKDLEIVDGVTTGKIDTGGIIATTLYSVKVFFVRREPKAIRPLIFPVWSAHKYQAPTKASERGLRRAVIASDAQVGFEKDIETGKLTPYHDRKALDVLLKVLADARPDEVHLPGDWLDLAESSTHFIRSPEMQMTTQPAIYEGHLWLAWIRALLPDAEIYLYEGNHERRIPDSLAQYLPWAYGLKRADAPYDWPVMSVPYLLGLDSLGIRWVDGYPDATSWLNERIMIEHGSTTKLKADDPFIVFRGHDHRLGLHSKTYWPKSGERYAMEIGLGCLSTTDAPGRQKRENWQRGFVVVDYEENGDRFSFDPVIIEGDAAIWEGRIYRGEDRASAVRERYPDLQW